MTRDTVTLATVFPVAIAIGVAHIIIGLCIMLEPRSLLVTSLAGVRWVTSVFSNGGSIGGMMLIGAGVSAMIGGIGCGLDTGQRLKLIAPQVVLLVFTIASVIATAVAGHYPDDYVPAGGWLFILSDQALAAAVSTFHVATVLMLPIHSPQFCNDNL